MSHATEITTQFNNLDAFKRALKSLRWNIEEKQKIRTYPGDPKGNEIYDYVGRNPTSGGYDIGFRVDDTTGQVKITWDSYGGSIERSLGKDFVNLKVAYAKEVTAEHYDEMETVEETDDYIIMDAYSE